MMNDMTMSEVLRDPLIRQMLRADGVSLSAFAQLLETAASRRNAAYRFVAAQPAHNGNRPAATAACPTSH